MANIIGATKLIKYHRFEKSKRKPRSKGLYRERDRLLKLIGFKCYKEYLESENWKAIRDKKITAYPRCVVCEKKSEQVHHLCYDLQTLVGMNWMGLVCMCSVCHAKIEFDEQGKKRTLEEANETLFGMTATSTWLTKYRKHEKYRKSQSKR